MKKSSRTLELDDECGMVCIGRRVSKPFLLLEWIERLSEKFIAIIVFAVSVFKKFWLPYSCFACQCLDH